MDGALDSKGIVATPGLTEAELEELLPRLQRPVLRLLLAELGDLDAAESLAQECFLRAFRHRSRFRGDGAPEGWVLRIAANLARDHRKSRAQRFWRRLLRLEAREEATERDGRPLPPLDPADGSPDAERELLQREAAERLRRRAAALPERQRLVFHLRFVDEMPLERIAATLGLATGSVKSHLARAVATLRRDLAD